MLFVNIYRYRDSMATVPVDKRAELLKAAVAYPEKYRKAGKLKAAYGFADRRGGLHIWEFDTGAEMARIIGESPIAEFVDREMIALVEPEAGTKLMEEAIKTAQKAAKK